MLWTVKKKKILGNVIDEITSLLLICTFLIIGVLIIYFLSCYHLLENFLVIAFSLSEVRLKCFPYWATRNLSVLSLYTLCRQPSESQWRGGLCILMPLPTLLSHTASGKENLGAAETSSMIFAPSLSTKEEWNSQQSPYVGQWHWHHLLLGSRGGTVALTRPLSFLFLEHLQKSG